MDIYALLNISPNASQEELRTAFLNWKKDQQKIILTGTKAQQDTAIKQISEITRQYKKIVGDSSPTPRKKVIKTTPSTVPTTHEDNNMAVWGAVAVVLILGVVFFMKNPSYDNFFNNKPQHFVDTVKPNADSPKPQVVEDSNLKYSAPPKTEKIDVNIGKTPTERAAVQVFLNFHENITKKDFLKAYDCLSEDFQNNMSYEGWIPGFKTTVSSTPSDLKIISSGENYIKLSYKLTAVDNPGGTQIFKGKVTIIKTGAGWKIDDIDNR